MKHHPKHKRQIEHTTQSRHQNKNNQTYTKLNNNKTTHKNLIPIYLSSIRKQTNHIQNKQNATNKHTHIQNKHQQPQNTHKTNQKHKKKNKKNQNKTKTITNQQHTTI